MSRHYLLRSCTQRKPRQGTAATEGRERRETVFICARGDLLDREETRPFLGVASTPGPPTSPAFCVSSLRSVLITHTHTHPFVTHIIAYSIQNSVPCSLHLTMCPADLFIAQYRASPLFWCLQNVPPDRCIATYLHSS